MHRFIYRENIRHYQELLERTTDEAERLRIGALLAEEEAKSAADPPPMPKMRQTN